MTALQLTNAQDELAKASAAAHDGGGESEEGGHAELGARVLGEDGEDAAGEEAEPGDADEDERRALEGLPEAARAKDGEDEQVEADEEEVPEEQDEREEHARKRAEPEPDRVVGGQGVEGEREGPDGAEDVQAAHDAVRDQDVAEAEAQAARDVGQRDGPALDALANRGCGQGLRRGGLGGITVVVVQREHERPPRRGERQGGGAGEGRGCHLDRGETGHEARHLLRGGDPAHGRDDEQAGVLDVVYCDVCHRGFRESDGRYDGAFIIHGSRALSKRKACLYRVHGLRSLCFIEAESLLV